MGHVYYKELARFPGYRVGSDGSVWSKHRRGYNPSGGYKTTWKQLKLSQQGGNECVRYFGVHLKNLNGKFVCVAVHVLVLEAFFGPRPKGRCARHFPDSDPANNNVTNLRWGTHKENADDRERDGNTARGVENKNSKLSEDAVHEIRAKHSGYGVQTLLAKKYGVSRQVIWQIKNRKTWTHI